jgi:phage host-nuclease inhibitor protein Gam
MTWQIAAIGVVTLGVGVALVQQHQVAEELRVEIAVEREGSRELAKLRTENQRLTAGQIAPDKLEALRTDHAAVVRLRAEIEALQRRIDDMNRTAAAKLSVAGVPK